MTGGSACVTMSAWTMSKIKIPHIHKHLTVSKDWWYSPRRRTLIVTKYRADVVLLNEGWELFYYLTIETNEQTLLQNRIPNTNYLAPDHFWINYQKDRLDCKTIKTLLQFIDWNKNDTNAGPVHLRTFCKVNCTKQLHRSMTSRLSVQLFGTKIQRNICRIIRKSTFPTRLEESKPNLSPSELRPTGLEMQINANIY